MRDAKDNGTRARAVALSPRAPIAWATLAASALVTLSACGSGASEPIAVDEESVTSNASDYCRETTCPAPSGYPKRDECAPAGWASSCADQGKWDVPLWWRTGCVGWSMQKDASAHVTFAEAESAVQAAFGAWTSVSCDGAPPSLGAVEEPPVTCDVATHADDGANQNAIIFHDTAWPHADAAYTIALTTTWFDARTGEILDGDIEINEATFSVGVHGETYDLQAVLTHEVGHFLGLAHSSSPTSAMYPSEEGRDRAKRSLTAADAAGLCAVYPPGGVRRVSTVVDASGSIAAGACDGTPIGGFSTTCN
jgi:hypothetical protein